MNEIPVDPWMELRRATMKQKPAVKNELLLEDTLTLHHEDTGVTLRVVVLYDDMVRIDVPDPKRADYADVHILLTSEQMEQLVTLWNEWKGDVEKPEPPFGLAWQGE